MNLIIAGLTGSGKTTHANLLAQRLGMTYISGSSIRLRYVSPNTATSSSDFWRLSGMAEKWDLARMSKPDADLAADEELCRLSRERDGLVFDVWALPWLKDSLGVCVWLECPLSIRATRLFKVLAREGLTLEDMERRVASKDERSREFILAHYGIDIFVDRTPFHIIFETGEPSTTSVRDEDAIQIRALNDALAGAIASVSKNSTNP